MEIAVKAAGWVVDKALGPVTDSLLQAWADSKGLGPNMDALKMELLYAQGLLDHAEGRRKIHSPALKEMLHKLRQLAYNADDVLDEVEYFRIQDAVNLTAHAADENGLVLHARHTAREVVSKLKPSSGSRDTIRGEHEDQDSNAKLGCLSTVCSCGGRTPSTDQDDQNDNGDGNGRQSFCGALPSKVQGCLSGTRSCGKREMSSSPPSPTNQDDQNNNDDGNGLQFFCGALPSKVQGCLSGTRLCGKREMSSSPPSSPRARLPAVCGCLPKVTSTACNTTKSIGKRLLCCSFQSVDENAHTGKLDNRNMPYPQTRDLKFNRAEISKKMKVITENLKPVCAKVSNILNLEFMNTEDRTKKDVAKNILTTSYVPGDHLYGRAIQKKKIVDGITHGECFANSNELVVLPIVGPGGIGKTTFTQHIRKEVKDQFDVCIWLCVSLDFNASRLSQEALDQIPKVGEEESYLSDQEKIERRLKAKRFLLVLDDMWECHDDEWKKLLAPFRRGGEKGTSMVIVTTRIPKTAKMTTTVENNWIKLEPLEAPDLKVLFEDCIFGGQQTRDPWEGRRELRQVGEHIMKKLKGFPLEVKTVGRLLRDQLDVDRWTRVLESKEWELQTDKNDIMPALKLSYDYLPFHLQQCFYYCGLFPEDYEFEREKLVHFWIGLDIIHPSDQNKRIEDAGMEYFDALVSYGFFKKDEKNGACYVVHDLLHNLAVRVSSFECLSIRSSDVKSIRIPQDVRHLSIIVDNDVKDINANFERYKRDLPTLKKRLKFENLRTLMLFGEHHGSFAKIFCDLFEKARALRAIYLCRASYTVQELLCNFSKLIHLRYLRIEFAYTEERSGAIILHRDEYMENTNFLSDLSKLYHLEVIDLQKCKGHYGFIRHMSNLAKLRLFLVPEYEVQLHSNIADVGKLTLLQELMEFEVGKIIGGFELSQLGQMSELGGSLVIRNLERIGAVNEAREARLEEKRLRKLTLEWDDGPNKTDVEYENKVLEDLIPHSNLQGLCIRGHGGSKCPPWLGEKISVQNLESLHLDGVAWNIFPPIGEFWLVNEPPEKIPVNIPHTEFQNLKRLELTKLRGLKKWVGDTPCQIFPQLEVLEIIDCSVLTELSFSHSNCCGQEKGIHMSWFPILKELIIFNCPELVSFPPIPWTSTPCIACIQHVGLGLERLICKKDPFSGRYSLEITKGEDSPDSMVWKLLAFDNLTELKELKMKRCPPLPLHHLQILSSLRTLTLWYSSSILFPLVEGESNAEYQCPIECIDIYEWGASAKELTRLLAYCPKLSELDVSGCEQATELGVAEKQATATSSSANKVKDTGIEQHQQPDVTGEEEVIVEEGLLLLPSQLKKLRISRCPNLSLRCNPVDHSREARRTGEAQGLQALRSLRSLEIYECPRLLSSYSSSSSSPRFPFPTSLEDLNIYGVTGMETLLPLSNLTSLTDLTIQHDGDLRGYELQALLTQGCLTRLRVYGIPNFFPGPEPSLPQPEFPSPSSTLQTLGTDNVARVLTAPMCTLLSSKLTDLYLSGDEEVKRFKKEQEEALQLLTSLETIGFGCEKLQCIPSLPKLKELRIDGCPSIRSLPKDSLPSSLQKLVIRSCPAFRSITKKCLPDSLKKLEISFCPAFRSLPKVEDLPRALREVNVRDSKSEDLRKHCRKLIGAIPIVKV